jgi:hypothetical protein
MPTVPQAAAQEALAATPTGPAPARTGDLVECFAHRQLTSQELDAARNCVSSSPHTKLTLLPNHAINVDGELEGRPTAGKRSSS